MPRVVSAGVPTRMPDGSTRTIVAEEAPHRVDEQIQSWDCSFKDLDTSDFVVGQVWARVGHAICWVTRFVDEWTALRQ
jgi:phage terminase large subunit-like protein